MNTPEDRPMKTYADSTIKSAVLRLFRRFPILSNEVIFRIVIIVLMLPLIVLLHRWKGECTCEDQIQDQRLTATSLKQNKQVQTYLKTRDNPVMCEARRQELLRKLEQEQKLRKAHAL
jgi:sensor histidine kinase YesM